MKLWKRNAVVAAIALFVCAAVYLNWSYDQQAQAGKTLGQSTMVGGQSQDPLLSQETDASAGDTSTAAPAQETAEPGSASGDYFAAARLNRQQARDSALSLLQETILPVSEVAKECGFTDESYFSRVIRRSVGDTPKRFRERA